MRGVASAASDFDDLDAVARSRRIEKLKRRVCGPQAERGAGFETLHLERGAGSGQQGAAVTNASLTVRFAPDVVRPEPAEDSRSWRAARPHMRSG